MSRLSCSLLSERQKFANLLRFCSNNSLFDQGLQIHAAVLKMALGKDLMLNNDLIDMYAKCGQINIARAVFDRMLERNVVSWTALMCGFLQNGNFRASLSLFSQMGSCGTRPNEYTYTTNLKACGLLGSTENGMQIHDMCVKTGFENVTVVGNSIIDMYSKCGKINEAAKIFNRMLHRNLISWNAMIAGYTLSGYNETALLLFQKLQLQGDAPDEFTITSILKACSGLGAFREGSQIHGFLITNGFAFLDKPAIVGALVDLNVKSGNLQEARRVFDNIEQKNVISWSVLILGYAQDENLAEAINLFRQFRESSIEIDGFALSSVMGVFADFALIEQGKQMHAYSIKIPSGLDISVANSTLDMYLKCGEIDEAEIFFSKMQVKNDVSWTAMITGYGKHGLGKEAVHLFKQMQSHNVEPDDVTYLAILSACSHSGLVEESREYFLRLRQDQKIKSRIEHYACMVDLLGRAGQLTEAKSLIESMPIKPNVAIWQTLLSACRMHRNMEMGREVGEIVLKLDGDNPVNYVMMSNIYADAGYWKECERLRDMVKEKGLKKVAGQSWVEIDKEVHFFYGGDNTHPLTEKIHEVLKEMERRMKEKLGYEYGLKYALHDVEEESKAESLRVHSEKLAIGLALVCGGVQGDRTIRVFKNLRVCGDCHEFIKGLSRILKVIFVVRDANRFHRFKDGLCSCGDYW